MDEDSIPILNASLKDLNALARLERVCFSKADAWPLLELVGVLVAPKTVRLKMEVDGTMIAFLAGDRRPVEDLGQVVTIAVAPDWRGRGLGRRLLAAGESVLGTRRVRLSVRASNDVAIALYSSSGYRQIGRIRHYYVGGEDGLVFEKQIPQLS